MFLTRISVNQPVFATMIMVALMVVGVYSFQRLPIEQLPDVDFPVVAVVVAYPGASPEAVENDIIIPIEDAVNTISGIDSIKSTARSGQAMIILMFDLGIDSASAAQDVRDRIATVQATLPDGANDPMLFKFDPSELPVLSLAVSADTMSLRDLTALTEDVIEPRLSIIPGVGRATVVGGVPRQLNVEIDPDRLTAFGVGVGEVTSAIRAENQNMPAGDIEQGLIVQTLQIEGRIDLAEDFLDIIVSRTGGQPVRLRDVAQLVDGEAEPTSLALLDGEQALAVDVVKTQGANTVAVAESIRQAIAELMADDLPEGVTIEVVRDNALPVEQSYHGVQNMMVEGAALAVLIVFLFLNSWRSTVITGLTLPIAVIGTMTVIYALGFTLNIMTLLALSLAIGLLIDDAIVVRENIMRHLHMGKSHRQAALDGTNEIGLAVLATTLSIVAVFLPVAFMEGIIGRFFLQFGVTVSVAVLISMFIAFTLDPMLSSVWYDPAAEPDAKRGPLGRLVALFGRFIDWLSAGYRNLLRWCLRFRLVTMGIALGAFVGSFALVPLVGVEFIPPEDNSQFQVNLETPVGSSLNYTAGKVRQVERLLRGFPEVISTYATINAGAESGGQNTAAIVVAMLPPSERERSPQDMTAPVRAALQTIPGIEFVIGAASGLGGLEAPVQVNLFGDNLDVLAPIADRLVRQLQGIDGLVDVESGLNAAQPVLGVRLNRDAASDLGVSLQQVGATLRPMLGGEDVSDWTAPDGRNFSVRVRLPAELRNDLEVLRALPIAQSGATGSQSMVRLDQEARRDLMTVRNLRVPSSAGQVPLEVVADVSISAGATEIGRYDRRYRTTVSANLAGGALLGPVNAQVTALQQQVELPAGTEIQPSGDAEIMGEVFQAFTVAMVSGVVLTYVVLVLLFHNFVTPVSILMSLPLAIGGAILALFLTGNSISMAVVIGFLMLMGIVTKNAIMLVEFAVSAIDRGVEKREAILDAVHKRARPIVMTTIAMTAGMVPSAIGTGEGAEFSAPMAIAVIGGLLLSTLLSLLFVPSLFSVVHGGQVRIGGWLRRRIGLNAAPEAAGE